MPSGQVLHKVQVWVTGRDSRGNRRVLLLRTLSKRGSFWQPVTGGVEPGEEISVGALRELTEETGLNPQALFPLGYEFEFESQRAGSLHTFHETCFGAEIPTDKVGASIQMDPKEHDAFEWISPKEALTRVKFESNRGALEVLLNRAADFELQDENGNLFRLSSEAKKQPILLTFYPGDFTPVCTKQLCSYRDDPQSFQRLGVRVVGVSPDSVSQHVEFRKKFNFPFTLLSDPEKKVFHEYGMVSKLLFGMTGRGVALVDTNMQMPYKSVEWTPLTYRGAGTLVSEIEKALKR